MSWLLKALLTLTFIVLLMKFPEESSKGVRLGLKICSESVIPSLFPMSVLCTFITASGLISVLKRLTAPFMKKLFRLPGSAFGAVTLGMLGGYPVGVRMTEELYRNKCISQNDANRMCLFCVCAGPAFTVGTVGSAMLNSPTAGRLLFASTCLSALTIGILLRFTSAESEEYFESDYKKPLVGALCEAVSSAGGAMLSVSAWIIFFTCICMTLKTIPETLKLPLYSLLEVTNGVREAVRRELSLPVIAAILGWSGLSVHCQAYRYTEKCGVKASHFAVSRIVSGALSAIYCKWLVRIFPVASEVILLRSGLEYESFSKSAPVSAAMLLTAGVFIIKTAGMTGNIYQKLTKKNP